MCCQSEILEWLVAITRIQPRRFVFKLICHSSLSRQEHPKIAHRLSGEVLFSSSFLDEEAAGGCLSLPNRHRQFHWLPIAQDLDRNLVAGKVLRDPVGQQVSLPQ